MVLYDPYSSALSRQMKYKSAKAAYRGQLTGSSTDYYTNVEYTFTDAYASIVASGEPKKRTEVQRLRDSISATCAKGRTALTQ
jgi:hypothetical protein